MCQCLYGIKIASYLRVSTEEETEGLDLVFHDERGYTMQLAPFVQNAGVSGLSFY